MSAALRLAVYFGERDRSPDGRPLHDAILGILAEAGTRAAVLLRGAEGFGARHHVRTDRLLTLSEDLPAVVLALGAGERLTPAAAAIDALCGDGLVTLERARLDAEPDADAGDVKLTVVVPRAGDGPAAVLDVLHRHGLAGGTALLGVDGVLDGARRTARFLGANRDVPALALAVGTAQRTAAAVRELRATAPEAPVLVERVRICRRDGAALAPPHAGDGWAAVRLTVHGREEDLHALLRALRHAGAAGATTLRGVRGFHGEHAPRGHALWQVRRRAPVVLVLVDAPARAARWFAVVEEHTRSAGLVTSEVVPAFRSASGGVRLGDGVHGL